MDTVWKIAAAAMVISILVVTVRSRNESIALLLSLCGCTVLLAAGIPMFQSVLAYLDQLQTETLGDSGFFQILLRVCAVSVLTHLCALFCYETGESAIAKTVELCGNAAALLTMLPLLEGVLAVINKLLGD